MRGCANSKRNTRPPRVHTCSNTRSICPCELEADREDRDDDDDDDGCDGDGDDEEEEEEEEDVWVKRMPGAMASSRSSVRLLLARGEEAGDGDDAVDDGEEEDEEA